MVRPRLTREDAIPVIGLVIVMSIIIIAAIKSLIRAVRGILAERQNSRCLRFGPRFKVPFTSLGHKWVGRRVSDDPRKVLKFASHVDVVTIPNRHSYSEEEKCWHSSWEIECMADKNYFECDLEDTLLSLQSRHMFYQRVRCILEEKLSRRRKYQVHFGETTETLIPNWFEYEPEEFLGQWYIPCDLEEMVERNYRQVEEEEARREESRFEEREDDDDVDVDDEVYCLSIGNVYFGGGSTGGGVGQRRTVWPAATDSVSFIATQLIIWWSWVWATIVVPHFGRTIT